MATIEKVQRREGIVYKAKVRREGHSTTGKSKYQQHSDFWVPRLGHLRLSEVSAPRIAKAHDGLAAGGKAPAWETARQRAGIEGFRWHDPRHRAASCLAKGGASLLEIGAVLGHKSANTTKRYAHLTKQCIDDLGDFQIISYPTR